MEPPTWTLLHGPCFPYVEPQRGLSNMDYVDPLRGAPYVGSLTWTLLICGPPYVEPQRGLSYMDPGFVDPLRGAFHVDSLVEAPTWTLLRGPCLCQPPYVEPPTWTLLHGPCLCGPPTWSPNVDSLTWTLLMWTPCVEPPTWSLLRGPCLCGPPAWSPRVRGLSYVDPAYVDPPTWIPLRGLSYVDPSYVDPPYMVGFQNGFSQNGALIAIPWGPASKSPLSSNHTQSTGMLNIEGVSIAKTVRGV